MIDLATLSALCGPVLSDGGTATLFLGAMFTAGLAGSAFHCGPMCGGFVLAQTVARLGAVPAAALCERVRIGAGLLPGYHAGRIATYAALGAAAGWLGAGLLALAPLRAVAAGLLLAAAGLFAATGLGLLRRGAGAPPLLARVVGHPALAARFGRRGGLGIGLVLGLLPCGLVYAALAAAAAGAAPLAGAAGMVAFGLGTVPALAAIGVVGERLIRGRGAFLRRAAPWVMGFNATLLTLLAIRLV